MKSIQYPKAKCVYSPNIATTSMYLLAFIDHNVRTPQIYTVKITIGPRFH